MATDAYSQIPEKLWVGMWKSRRQVVYDPSIQLTSKSHMLLYFVQGQCLCVRERAADKVDVNTITQQSARTFAIAQYHLWKSRNTDVLRAKQEIPELTAENPGPIRKKCPVCNGNAHTTYTVGTFSDGAHSDGQNISEYCQACKGHGFVDNTIEA